MWLIWLRREISSVKDFEILWKFVIFQIFISTVLNNLHSTDIILPHVLKVSPMYWIPSRVLKLSPIALMLFPTVLKLSSTFTAVIPHSTQGIPPQYWIPSTVLMLSPACTDGIPHCTEQPPSYPPPYWSYPPTVLMLLPYGVLIQGNMAFLNSSIVGCLNIFRGPKLHQRLAKCFEWKYPVSSLNDHWLYSPFFLLFLNLTILYI